MGGSLPVTGWLASVAGARASAARLLVDALRPVGDFLYPPRCPACGDSIGAQSGLCLSCWDQLAPPDLAADPSVIAATSYGDVSRKLLLAFKHGGRIALAPLLARLIASRIDTADPQRLIIPVPLHPTRLWKRGYNQSALLGRELARLGHGRLVVDGLERIRRTPALDRRSGAERRALLTSAIRVNPRHVRLLQGADVLLVDDVVTSGATTDACRRALRSSGVAVATVACFARVGTGPKSMPVRSARIRHMGDTSCEEATNARDHAIPGVP